MGKGKKGKKVPPKVRDCEMLAHWAWAVIANANEGNWEAATPEWQDAARTWRDRYHDWLDGRPLPPLMDDEG
jgi:hypothetical protein